MASAPAIHIGKRTYTLFAAAVLVALAGCASGGSSTSTTTSETTSGISAASLIPGPTGPLESSTITVEAVPTADEAGLYIAAQLGYFKKEGLNVKVEITGGGDTALPDLFPSSNGTPAKADIVVGNYISFIQGELGDVPQAESAVVRGNIKILADGSQMQEGNQALYVMSNSKFSTIADLVKYHATIGVNTENNIGTLLVGSLLTDNGYPDDVNTKNGVQLVVPPASLKAPTPFVGALEMLEDHQLDAAWLPEPYGTLAQEAGAVKLADFDQGSLENFPIGAYIASSSWVQKNPQTIAAFLHALQEGQEVADTSRSQVEQALIKYTLVGTGFKQTQADQIASLLTLDTYPLTMDIPTMQRVSDSMFQFGLEPGLTAPYDISKMIESEPGEITGSLAA